MDINAIRQALKGLQERRDLGMTDQQIDLELANAGANYRVADLEEQVSSISNKARLVGQGLTLGFGDEIEAGIASVNPFDRRSYDQALSDTRTNIDAFRQMRPGLATTLEIGGAVLPTAAAALATLPAGGSGAAPIAAGTAARIAPTLARTALTGAAEGGVYGFGTGEGGLGNRAVSAAIDAPLGAVGGVGTNIALRQAGKLGGAVLDFARRKFGNRGGKLVEAELQKIVERTGMTVDEIVSKIGTPQEGGRIMADMSETLRQTLRAYKASAIGATDPIAETVERRAKDARGLAQDQMQESLTKTSGNILRLFNKGAAATKRAASNEYNKIWATGAEASDDVVAALRDALGRDASLADDVKKLARVDKAGDDFFEVLDDGMIEFTGPVTLHQAEIVRRAIDDKVSSAYKDGQGQLGGAYKNLEENLRDALDASSPELAKVRSVWSRMMRAQEVFEQGQKSLGKSADQVAVDFEELVAEGPEVVNAFRTGLMSSYRAKFADRSRKSLAKHLADDESKDGVILRMVVPEDELDEVINRVELAADTGETAGKVLGNSPTAETTARMADMGSTAVAEDVVSALNANPLAVGRLLFRAKSALQSGLTDADKRRVAEILISEDPGTVMRALRDDSQLAKLQAKINGLARVVAKEGSALAPIVAAQQAQPITDQLEAGLLN
jgi:hypothetical protein